jgi:hypothetical protein
MTAKEKTQERVHNKKVVMHKELARAVNAKAKAVQEIAELRKAVGDLQDLLVQANMKLYQVKEALVAK